MIEIRNSSHHTRVLSNKKENLLYSINGYYKLIIIAVILLSNAVYCSAQNQTELWGVTSSGGNDAGVIFKTSSYGNNQQVVYNFAIEGPGEYPVSDLCQAMNGKLYGVTYEGGAYRYGVIFEYDPVTNTSIKKIDFNGTGNGSLPHGAMIQASNGNLYGMAYQGGLNGVGVLYEYNPTTNVCTKKMDMGGLNGGPVNGSLVQALNGKLYGMSMSLGLYEKGVIFEYDPVTGIFTKKLDFNGTSNGSYPYSSLILASNGKLYGMTSKGGVNDMGTLFEYDPVTNTLIKKLEFAGTSNGNGPEGSLIQASNGRLYGMTYYGGAYGKGVLFEFEPDSNRYTKKIDFSGATNGKYPNNSLIQASNGKLYGFTKFGGTNNMGVLFEYDLSTDTYIKKLDFAGTSNGCEPNASLIQASDGKLYGTTSRGGTYNMGTLIEFDPVTDTFIKKLNFAIAQNGANPKGTLLQASDGRLYGITSNGGANNMGVLFEFNPSTHTLIKKLDFAGASNGKLPNASVIQAPNGKLYGLTYQGGANDMGVLYEYDLTTSTYTKKLDFNGTANGKNPYGALMQASNGKLYGMTYQGGTSNYGVIFEYDPVSDIYTKKYDFVGLDNGKIPYSGLIEISSGKLYGMTCNGGANAIGVIFEYDFTTRIYTKKFDFTNSSGGYPYGSLIKATNEKLYGVTYGGGANGYGVLFEFNPANNTYINKLNFTGATNGAYPNGSLIQSSNGNLYGMTPNGGSNDIGVLFEYNPTTSVYTKKLDFNNVNGKLPTYTQLIETCSYPEISSNPGNASICRGSGTRFIVIASGNGLSYQWQVDEGSGFTDITDNTIYSGAINDTLNISNEQTAMDGFVFRCMITSTCPALSIFSETATLSVFPDYIFIETQSICDGEIFNWQGTAYTSSITDTVRYNTIHGCDSIYILNLTVNPFPANAGVISGIATVLQATNSVTYSVPAVANASSYIWSYSGTGATINGTGPSVTVDFSSGATSGQLKVKGHNSCGDGTESSFSISIQPRPTYLLELRNDVQVSCTVFEFDVYLLRTGTNPLELSTIQFGIVINSLMKNGGTIQATLVPGSIDPILIAANENLTNFGFTQAQNCIKVSPRTPPGAGNGAIISDVSLGTRLCRIRLTNSVSFGHVPPDLTWTTTNFWPTQIGAYVGGSNVSILNYPSHTTSNLANLVLNFPAAPTGTPSQPFCSDALSTVGNLAATGTSIQWYAASSGGTALATSTALVSGTHYYASQTVGSCESSDRLDVTAIFYTTTAPIGTASQSFCFDPSPTIANLAATGNNIKWYATSSGGTVLATSTALTTTTHYWASQTENGCESQDRFDVTVIINGQMNATLSSVNSTCYGSSNGSITFTNPAGGSGAWNFSITGGAPWFGSAIFSGLGSGTYTAAIQDENNHSCIRSLSSIIITQPAASNGGSVTGGTSPISYGSNTGTMTVSGYTGTIIKWKKRLDSDPWTDISNTNNTYSEIPASIGTWKYIAVVQNGTGCPTANSVPLSLIVSDSVSAVVGINVGLYNTECGKFAVKLKPSGRLNNLTITNIIFTIKWPQNTVNIVQPETAYGLAQQGNVITYNGYNYIVFASAMSNMVNWLVDSEYTVLTFRHDESSQGTADFRLIKDSWTQLHGTDFYVEVLGDDLSGYIYHGANGTYVGDCYVELKAGVILQGAYNSTTGMMDNTISTNNMLPLTQPYNISPWNYTGAEHIHANNTDIVDWVLVELRDTTTTTVIDRRAGLLLKNGDIVDTSLTHGLYFYNCENNGRYYITILHRNHLSVMTGNMQKLPNLNRYDFSDTLIHRPYGGGNRALIELTGLGAGKFGMIAGDANHDGKIKFSGPLNDRAPVLTKLVALTGQTIITGSVNNVYLNEDVDLNSSVKYTGAKNDPAIILQNLIKMNHTTSITGLFYTSVPSATIYYHKRFNDGPIDLITQEDSGKYYISLRTNEVITDGMIDNIQFTLSWATNDLETERLLLDYSTAFNLSPQGDIFTSNGKKYMVFATTEPKELPILFEAGESIVILSIPKDWVNNLLSRKINVANDQITIDKGGEYYVSLWGEDVSGKIKSNAIGIEENNIDITMSIYPNPSKDGRFKMNITSGSDQLLSINVFNIYGVCVYVNKIRVKAGLAYIKDIYMNKMPKGTYIIELLNEKIKFRNKLIIL